MSLIHSLKKQRGGSLLVAVFFMILLAMLSAALFRMQGLADVGVAQEVLSIRAFYAAETGLQLQRSKVLPLTGIADSVCAVESRQLSMSGLQSCEIQTRCEAITVNAKQYYDIFSTGRCGSGTQQTSRTVMSRIEQG